MPKDDFHNGWTTTRQDRGVPERVPDSALKVGDRVEHIDNALGYAGTIKDIRGTSAQIEWDKLNGFVEEVKLRFLKPAATGEVRSVSSTGGAKGVKPQRFDLIPVKALNTLASMYGEGVQKYNDTPANPNWRKGYEWSKSYAALMRHVTQFWGGEDLDAESGHPHLAAVAFHAFALLTFMDEHPEFDDRFTPRERGN